MNEIQQVILHAQSRFRTIRIQRAFLVFIAVFAMSMTFAAVLDRTWMFSGMGRWAGWALGLIAAIVFAKLAAGPTCPQSSVFARNVETEAGESTPVVSTALDPSVREIASQDPYGRVMLSQLDQRAKEAVRKAPPSFKGRLKMPIGLLSIAILSAYGVISVHGLQGLQRMFMPWEVSPYTSLFLRGPENPIAEGKPFELYAKVSGIIPPKVTLYQKGNTTPLAEATPDEEGQVKFSVNGRKREVEFVAIAGDGQSEPLLFAPYLLPRIQSFEISVTLPDYSTKKPDTEARPSFSVFRGSQVKYRIHLAAPATRVTLLQDAIPSGDERITDAERANLLRGAYGVMVGKADAPIQDSNLPPFQPVPDDPLVWEANWNLTSPGDIVYRLKIEGEKGDVIQNEEPWRINILDDKPPEIYIVHHNGGEVIKTGKETVKFDLRASDDLGIAKIRLVFRKPGDDYQALSVTLPEETTRDWSGPALLKLSPLDLSPLDIVAVHAEVEDDNSMDGPGIGRSEVVFIEVPFPESDGSSGGGGGGGGGAEPINPLHLQMEILKSTMTLGSKAPPEEMKTLANDQRQNASYAGQLEGMMTEPALQFLAFALADARESMEKAAAFLENQPPPKAIPDEEAALGYLVEAAKLLDDAIKEGLLPANCKADGMSFTLRPPKSSSSESEGDESESEKDEEALRKLVEEVKRQLEEQETLNQGDLATDQKSDRQSSLSKEATASAQQARDLPPSSSGRGDPKAAAEALERAARHQEDTAEALAEGDHAASAELGEKSADALDQALQQLSAQLEIADFASDNHPEGFERLVNDYLRSISYE